jgi:phenylacetate-CoA ligase
MPASAASERVIWDRAETLPREQLEVLQLLREHTGLRINVSVAEPGTIPRSEGKAVRVLDRRA